MDSRGYEILQTPIGLFKRIASYFMPVKIWKGSSAENPVLELFLYRDQWQLSSKDAIYSDGNRYTPLLLGFNSLRKELREVKNVLVLGAGLGNAVAILNRMQCFPSVTLVDIDKEILQLSKILLPDEHNRLNYVLCDAKEFMAGAGERFDLIVVDVFKERAVPAFVAGENFLADCRRHLSAEGKLVMNYMISSVADWQQFQNQFAAVFPDSTIILHGVNRILIARV